MFGLKPMGEVKEIYPVPPEVLTRAKAESNRNDGIRYVVVVDAHPVMHWNVAMIVDVQEGIYVRCRDCGADAPPHVIAEDHSADALVMANRMNGISGE